MKAFIRCSVLVVLLAGVLGLACSPRPKPQSPASGLTPPDGAHHLRIRDPYAPHGAGLQMSEDDVWQLWAATDHERWVGSCRDETITSLMKGFRQSADCLRHGEESCSEAGLVAELERAFYLWRHLNGDSACLGFDSQRPLDPCLDRMSSTLLAMLVESADLLGTYPIEVEMLQCIWAYVEHGADQFAKRANSLKLFAVDGYAASLLKPLPADRRAAIVRQYLVILYLYAERFYHYSHNAPGKLSDFVEIVQNSFLLADGWMSPADMTALLQLAGLATGGVSDLSALAQQPCCSLDLIQYLQADPLAIRASDTLFFQPTGVSCSQKRARQLEEDTPFQISVTCKTTRTVTVRVSRVLIDAHFNGARPNGDPLKRWTLDAGGPYAAKTIDVPAGLPQGSYVFTVSAENQPLFTSYVSVTSRQPAISLTTQGRNVIMTADRPLSDFVLVLPADGGCQQRFGVAPYLAAGSQAFVGPPENVGLFMQPQGERGRCVFILDTANQLAYSTQLSATTGRPHQRNAYMLPSPLHLSGSVREPSFTIFHPRPATDADKPVVASCRPMTVHTTQVATTDLRERYTLVPDAGVDATLSVMPHDSFYSLRFDVAGRFSANGPGPVHPGLQVRLLRLPECDTDAPTVRARFAPGSGTERELGLVVSGPGSRSINGVHVLIRKNYADQCLPGCRVENGRISTTDAKAKSYVHWQALCAGCADLLYFYIPCRGNVCSPTDEDRARGLLEMVDEASWLYMEPSPGKAASTEALLARGLDGRWLFQGEPEHYNRVTNCRQPVSAPPSQPNVVGAQTLQLPEPAQAAVLIDPWDRLEPVLLSPIDDGGLLFASNGRDLRQAWTLLYRRALGKTDPKASRVTIVSLTPDVPGLALSHDPVNSSRLLLNSSRPVDGRLAYIVKPITPGLRQSFCPLLRLPNTRNRHSQPTRDAQLSPLVGHSGSCAPPQKPYARINVDNQFRPLALLGDKPDFGVRYDDDACPWEHDASDDYYRYMRPPLSDLENGHVSYFRNWMHWLPHKTVGLWVDAKGSEPGLVGDQPIDNGQTAQAIDLSALAPGVYTLAAVWYAEGRVPVCIEEDLIAAPMLE